MGILENFSTGERSGIKVSGDHADPRVFFDNADLLLREIEPEVYEKVVPHLENYEGNWHPLKFMSWKLGTIAGIGTLRLHAWPAGLRRGSPRGPKIHDHAWHLASIVKGVYTDTIFDVQEVGQVASEEERQRQGLLRVFRPVLTTTSAALETDGTCAIATPTENRVFPDGTIHHIPIKTFHITDIPQDRLVSTIVLESPAINGHTRILMDTPMDPLRDPKHIIPADEAVLAKEQIMQGL